MTLLMHWHVRAVVFRVACTSVVSVRICTSLSMCLVTFLGSAFQGGRNVWAQIIPRNVGSYLAVILA